MNNGKFSRTSLWLVAGAFVLATSAGTVWGQDVNPTKVKKPAWREEPGAMAAGMARTSGAGDRAIGRVNVSQLDHRTHNFGDMGTTAEGWHTSRYPAPDGSLDSWGWNQSMALAIGAGSWNSLPQVHESTGDFQSLSYADWEAMDGARGAQFSNPPQTWGGYPLFATSDLPGTWPPGGWPAPESTTDIWWGTDTWLKWERRADKEVYCEFDDAGAARNTYSDVLDISVKKRVLGYGSLDGVFFQFELTNNSSTAYTNCFLGHFGDLGSPVYSSWTGYPVYDATRNMTYMVGDSYNASTGSHTDGNGNAAAWFGFVMLESPTGSFKTDTNGTLVDNPADALQRLALTHWEDATYGEDEELYGALTAYTQYLSVGQSIAYWKTGSDKLNPVLEQTTADWLTQYDPSNPDNYIYRASGEFTFNPGESINMVVAVVASNTEGGLLANADKAMRFYQARFKTSGPPPSPVVSVPGLLAGPNGVEFNPDIHSYRIYYTDPGSVTLTWDASTSETALDPITAAVEFEGYKIYRSLNRGLSWGEPVTDSQGNQIGSVPVAQFDLKDDVKDDYLGFYIGDDTGVAHTWTDTDVLDGLEYWYAVTTYDYAPPEPAYESAIGGDPTTPNVVGVIAGPRPSGYLPGGLATGSTGALVPTATGGTYTADGTASVLVVSSSETSNSTYRITTIDSAGYGQNTYTNVVGVTLENLTAGTTLYSGLLPENLSTFGANLLPVVDGIQVVIDTKFNGVDPYDRTGFTFPTEFSPYSGYEMIYGDDWFMNSSIDHTDLDDAATKYFTAEIRFDTLQTQLAYVYNRSGGYGWVATSQFPGTVWDVSGATDRQVNIAYTRQSSKGTNYDWDIDDSPLGSNRHYTSILQSTYSSTVDTAYTIDVGPPARNGTKSDWRSSQLDHVWSMIAGTSSGLTWRDLHGKTATWNYTHPLGAGWQFQFSTTAPTTVDTLIDYDDIKPVPNPYFVRAEWDRNVNRRKIMFTNVPANCTIDIYTLTGEMVASLDHSGSALAAVGTQGYNSDRIGTVVWNLWTYEYTEAAYGLYIYVVKVGDDVKKVGKLAIIR